MLPQAKTAFCLHPGEFRSCCKTKEDAQHENCDDGYSNVNPAAWGDHDRSGPAILDGECPELHRPAYDAWDWAGALALGAVDHGRAQWREPGASSARYRLGSNSCGAWDDTKPAAP